MTLRCNLTNYANHVFDHVFVGLANISVFGNCRLIWICVPLCVVGVLLVAQPSGLFGGRGAISISATGLAVGIMQVRASLWAWPCTCKSILFAIPIWQTCIDKNCIIFSLDSCLLTCRQLLQLATRSASAT